MSESVLSSSTPQWLELFGKMAPMSSVILYMAPIPTIQQLSRRESVGSLPMLPYSSMLINTFLWLVYGVMKSEPKLYICQGIGLILSIYYVLTFSRFAPKQIRSPTLPGSVNEHLQICTGTLLAITILALTDKAVVIGNLGVFICILMYASPLAAAKNVIATKSAESIPLPFTIASILSCYLWIMVGLFDMNDIFVYLPCVLGLACGFFQVALKLLYGDGSKQAQSSNLINSVDVEIKKVKRQ